MLSIVITLSPSPLTNPIKAVQISRECSIRLTPTKSLPNSISFPVSRPRFWIISTYQPIIRDPLTSTRYWISNLNNDEIFFKKVRGSINSSIVIVWNPAYSVIPRFHFIPTSAKSINSLTVLLSIRCGLIKPSFAIWTQAPEA
ncbi:Uncharacterised protein [Streptococcus pneumoniae]|nr:Uncharacterised protein [Streptococcus pneumoniae]